MSEPPQTPTPAAKRDANGRILPGQGSLNPGGQPQWVGSVRKMLEACVIDGVVVLQKIIAGDREDIYLTKSGEELKVECRAKDKIAAVKLAMEFTLSKPKQEVEVNSSSGETSELRREVLARLVGLDS